MSTIVTANDGTTFDLDNIEQTLGYTGDNLTSISVTIGTYVNNTPADVTYVQTLSYSGDNLVGVSNWEAQ